MPGTSAASVITNLNMTEVLAFTGNIADNIESSSYPEELGITTASEPSGNTSSKREQAEGIWIEVSRPLSENNPPILKHRNPTDSFDSRENGNAHWHGLAMVKAPSTTTSQIYRRPRAQSTQSARASPGKGR
ncbi:hypothetical protein H2198_005343 [Neophaeococcomyces mojaviensis]|uniref:Uncharacterized protein n=1 Tax=Neophaeococcomyces mojaviensis TaxID=3383035 RepID=A0ACC3A5Z2_9EURO|nr:hypothetical protein H2198_005343 [Knufia sp. JES_112]